MSPLPLLTFIPTCFQATVCSIPILLKTIKRKLKRGIIEIGVVEKGKKDWFIPGSITKLYATASIMKFGEALKHSIEVALKVPDDTIIAVLKGMIARPSRLTLMESGKIPLLWILGASDNLINCEAVQSKSTFRGMLKSLFCKTQTYGIH